MGIIFKRINFSFLYHPSFSELEYDHFKQQRKVLSFYTLTLYCCSHLLLNKHKIGFDISWLSRNNKIKTMCTVQSWMSSHCFQILNWSTFFTLFPKTILFDKRLPIFSSQCLKETWENLQLEQFHQQGNAIA